VNVLIRWLRSAADRIVVDADAANLHLNEPARAVFR
jgi:hypothetical protein